MNVHQTLAARTQAVAYTMAHHGASVCLNTKAIHRKCNAAYHKILVTLRLADLTLSALFYRMVSPNVPV